MRWNNIFLLISDTSLCRCTLWITPCLDLTGWHAVQGDQHHSPCEGGIREGRPSSVRVEKSSGTRLLRQGTALQCLCVCVLDPNPDSCPPNVEWWCKDITVMTVYHHLSSEPKISSLAVKLFGRFLPCRCFWWERSRGQMLVSCTPWRSWKKLH